MRTALRRAVSSHLLVWVVLLAAGAAAAGAALAGFSAETRGQATYAGGWVSPPSALQTPSPLGYGARLNWTAGSHGMGGSATQALLGSQFSSNPATCTSATYADFSTTGLSPTLATTWDNRGSTLSGYWICYRLESRHGSWSSGANFALVQIGLVPAGIASANVTGGTGGSIENNDTITLTFNQPITYTGSTPINVCAFAGASGAGSIVIGPSSCSSSSNVGSIGKISGLTIAASRTYPTSAVAVVTGNTKQFRVTMGGGATGTSGRTTVATTGTTAFAFTGSASLVTSVADVPNGIPAANLCTVTARCPWTYSGGF